MFILATVWLSAQTSAPSLLVPAAPTRRLRLRMLVDQARTAAARWREGKGGEGEERIGRVAPGRTRNA
jgi:hypothetical protein